MPVQTGLEPVIDQCCYSQKTDFDELQDEIIANFASCDLSECSIHEARLTKLRQSNGRKLIMTRPKFREYFRNRLFIRLTALKMVKEKGYHVEDGVFCEGCDREMVEKLIEQCLNIFVEKQKSLIS